MEKSRKVFKVEFNDVDIQEMKPIDGALAVFYNVYYMILLFCFGLIMFNTDIYDNLGKQFANTSMYRFIFYIPITLLSILPAIIMIYFRKQSISSLGLRRTKMMRSLTLGFLFGLPFLIPNVLNGVVNGYKFKSVELLTWDFLYYLICIGLVEEVIYRGFIQTRIRGIIKNKWLSIFVVGLMFSSLHIPFQMMKANLPIIEFIQYDLVHLITLIGMHIYFVFIYTKDNSLLAPIITHAIINFSNYLFM